MSKRWINTMVLAAAVVAAGAESAYATSHDGSMMGKQCRGNMMDMLDADKDGKVSKEEFSKHHDDMFSNMDSNGDGTLDASELDHANHKKHHKGHHKHK